jgi:N-acetylneuraminate lyase
MRPEGNPSLCHLAIMSPILSGLIAATFTPFLPNEELNLAIVPQMADLLVRNGVSGAFICGTTGEGFSMTSDERRRTAEAWRNATPSGLKLIVHVGHLSLLESCTLAKHAQQIGADAIATIAPCFFKPAGPEELVAWCQRVAGAAPTVPFYYYHMPAMTGIDISATDFLACADGKIPNLAGIKFTHEDLDDYEAARRFAGGRYDILFGRDEILLSGLHLGATGAVGSTYNFAAPLYSRIMRAMHSQDLTSARRDQDNSQAFIDVMARFGGLPAGKAMMKLIGLDCGPVRLPLRNLSAGQEAALGEALKTLGFFDYASVA